MTTIDRINEQIDDFAHAIRAVENYYRRVGAGGSIGATELRTALDDVASKRRRLESTIKEALRK